MSSEEPGGDESAGEHPDNVLYDLYETYIGEPDEDSDVYLGFGLFFTGAGMGILSLLLFGVSFGLLEYGTDAYWLWSEVAYAVGLLGLPALITGVVVLLPVEDRAVYAAATGLFVNVLAVAWFSSAYPSTWNNYGIVTTLEVVGLYALGLLLVIGSTGAALVADQLERYQKPGPADIQPVEASEDEEAESIRDEDIEADIESAMADVELSWGGMSSSNNRNLSFSGDAEMETTKLSGGEAKTTRSSGIDSQLDSLKAMKGGEKKTARSASTVDDQTSKLKELRERRKREQAEKDAAAGGSGGSLGGDSDGMLSRVKRALGLS